MKYDLVLLTVYFSIFMQFATSIVQFDGIFIKLPEEDAILTDILKMETIVQVLFIIFTKIQASTYHGMQDNRQSLEN